MEFGDRLRNCMAEALYGRGVFPRAARYLSLNPDAHYWRPGMVIGIGECFDVSYEQSIPLAASIELMHCATLAEDDMLDNTDKRRGKPAVHIKFGKFIGKTLSHFLLARAEEYILENGSFSKDFKINFMKRSKRTIEDLLVGEHIDMEILPRMKRPSMKIILKSNELKTGSLFRHGAQSVGELGGASPGEIARLGLFGLNYGGGFQLWDDKYDKSEDKREGKRTIYLIYGKERNRALIEKYLGVAASHLGEIDRDMSNSMKYLDSKLET